MKLFIAFLSAVFAQVDYEAFDLTEEEVFGSGDSELAQLADAYDANDLIGFGRSSGFGDSEVTDVIGGRSLPPGVNIQDFLVNGVFQMNDFREALMAAYQAAAAAEAVEEEPEEERYFFTTQTTTTTTPTTTTTVVMGDKCWKCDAMTYATCASTGSFQECPLGDKDCCFVEIREQNQKLQQLCTGCKERTACEQNRLENFKDPTAVNINMLLDQCKPDYRQQKIGRRAPQQSVCRQCFSTCDNAVDTTTQGSDYCFGSISSASTTRNVAFNLNTNQAKFLWNGHLSQPDSDFLGFGIPTHAVLDGTQNSGAVSEIENANANTATNPEVLNVFFKLNANTNSKVYDTNLADNTPAKTTEMTYWGLQGAPRGWWVADLKVIQTTLNGITGSAGIFSKSNFV